MSSRTVAVIGAGAAGTAAAGTLHKRGADDGIDIEVDLFARTGEHPHNRTLVNKGVAIGLLEPQQTALPDTGARLTADTVRGIDPRTRRLHLDSGRSETFDALIISSGSRPRHLDEEIIGRDQAVAAGRLTTLHSLADAVRVRDRLTTAPARVLLLGGGILGHETASLLTDAGHDVALIARAPVPGAGALGEAVAQQLLALHQGQHGVYLGRDVRAIRTHSDRITIVLDDNTQVDGDLAIVAHGTLPVAPAPWTGPDGIAVDSRLRTLSAPDQRIYAAGGVAVHHYPGRSSYRIDHWDDATAQGAHAAKALLHDLGLTEDPGPYLPTSIYSARIHGHTLVGAGHPAIGTSTQVMSSEPLLVAHCLERTPVALIGIDPGHLLHDHATHLHQQIPSHR
ncbi:MAG: FAD-dependent oxidoreductase [Dietzia sp.]|nr:FAD-dependent oxidoreductase [Dietzia sp.]